MRQSPSEQQARMGSMSSPTPQSFLRQLRKLALEESTARGGNKFRCLWKVTTSTSMVVKGQAHVYSLDSHSKVLLG